MTLLILAIVAAFLAGYALGQRRRVIYLTLDDQDDS